VRVQKSRDRAHLFGVLQRPEHAAQLNELLDEVVAASMGQDAPDSGARGCSSDAAAAAAAAAEQDASNDQEARYRGETREAARDALNLLLLDGMSFLHSDDDEEVRELPITRAVSAPSIRRKGPGKEARGAGPLHAQFVDSPTRGHAHRVRACPVSIAMDIDQDADADSTAACAAATPASALTTAVHVPVYHPCPHRTMAGDMLLRTLDRRLKAHHPKALSKKGSAWAFFPASTQRGAAARDTFNSHQTGALEQHAQIHAAGVAFLLRAAADFISKPSSSAEPQEESGTPVAMAHANHTPETE
jgi:hypothetical protein